MTRAVQNTAELRRIAALPRRAPNTEAAALLTSLLRTPAGTMTLQPVQAAALWDIATHRGGLLPIGVGFGKTLISFLAFAVLDAERPLLLNPAALIPKTLDAMAMLREHWQFPEPRIESYAAVSRDPDLLATIAPDVIVADEAHALKNPKSGCGARVLRARDAGALCVFESGSFTTRSILEYAHLAWAALGPDKSPLPTNIGELREWASALDIFDPRDPTPRLAPGALRVFVGPEDWAGATDELEATRRGYRRRLTETPGVVATDAAYLGTSLVIARADYTVGPAAQAALDVLRDKWELPDGTRLVDGLEVTRHAKDLALGFYSRMNPPAPEAWLVARAKWNAALYSIQHHNRRGLNTESECIAAVEEGLYPQHAPALGAWRAIEPTFTPNIEHVWIDDCGLAGCERWAQRNPAGIIWAKRLPFARALAARLDVPCYGEGGLDAAGNLFPQWGGRGHAKCGEGVVVSTLANATGMNLQGWNRALVVFPMSGGDVWEQCLGRLHRQHQPADTVTYDVILATEEQRASLAKARESARYIEQTTGQPQRLTYADDLTKG